MSHYCRVRRNMGYAESLCSMKQVSFLTCDHWRVSTKCYEIVCSVFLHCPDASLTQYNGILSTPIYCLACMWACSLTWFIFLCVCASVMPLCCCNVNIDEEWPAAVSLKCIPFVFYILASIAAVVLPPHCVYMNLICVYDFLWSFTLPGPVRQLLSICQAVVKFLYCITQSLQNCLCYVHAAMVDNCERLFQYKTLATLG